MSPIEKIIIAAVSENNVIGNNGKIPWNIPEDLQHFRELTLDYPVVMGRKTCKSLGKPLDRRSNIVVTRNMEFSEKGFLVYHSIREALERVEDFYKFISDLGGTFSKSLEKHTPRVFFIGGGEIYKQTIHLADRLELTKVHQTVKGDTFFPKINYDVWEEASRQDFPDFSFVSYRRV